jgi:hypothetical protein
MRVIVYHQNRHGGKRWHQAGLAPGRVFGGLQVDSGFGETLECFLHVRWPV